MEALVHGKRTAVKQIEYKNDMDQERKRMIGFTKLIANLLRF